MTDAYLDYLAAQGDHLDRMHEELLPLQELRLDADGVAVRLTPTAPGSRSGRSWRSPRASATRSPNRRPPGCASPRH